MNPGEIAHCEPSRPMIAPLVTWPDPTSCWSTYPCGGSAGGVERQVILWRLCPSAQVMKSKFNILQLEGPGLDGKSPPPAHRTNVRGDRDLSRESHAARGGSRAHISHLPRHFFKTDVSSQFFEWRSTGGIRAPGDVFGMYITPQTTRWLGVGAGVWMAANQVAANHCS